MMAAWMRLSPNDGPPTSPHETPTHNHWYLTTPGHTTPDAIGAVVKVSRRRSTICDRNYAGATYPPATTVHFA